MTKITTSRRWVHLLWMIPLLIFGWSSGTNAQAVNDYSFTQTSGTYTPITGGTVLWSGYDGFDDNISSSIPLTFVYHGTTYTSIFVSANGNLKFGATSTSNTPISGGLNAVAPFSVDLDAKSASAGTGVPEVRYEQVGDEFIVQWANVCRYTGSGASSTENLNFQVRLNTVNGVIKIVYGACVERATPTTTYPQVGLAGGSTTAYSNRTIAAGGGDWINSIAGTSNSQTMAYNGTTIPSNGLTYTWTPPLPCAGTPDAGTLSGATVRPTCGGSVPIPATITVTGQSAGVTGITFQWEQSTDNVTWTNATGTGNATINYTIPAHTAGQTEYYRLKATCTASGLVDYSDVLQITDPANPTTPTTNVGVSPIGNTTATITWTNGSGVRRFVVINTTNSFTDPVNGSGSALSASATYSGSGEQIVYDGTGTSVAVTGLTPSSTYYVRVYEYLRCGSSAPYTYYYQTSIGTNNSIDFTTSLYCAPTTSGGTTYYISNFTTTGGLTNINNNSGGSATGYENFSSTASLSVTLGSTINYSMFVAGSSTYGRSIWVDWDGNGDFSASEQVASSTSYLSPPLTGSFNIPLDATAGDKRMRILASFTPANPSNSCSNSGSGEYEDYTLSVPSCTGTPDAASIPATATVCPGGTYNLMATSTSLLYAGISFQWQQSTTSGGPYVDVTGATTTSYTTDASLAPGTYYYVLKTICNNSGLTSLSNEAAVTVSLPLTAPSVTNSVQCGPQVPTASVASTAGAEGSGIFLWYDAATDGNLLQGASYGSTLSPWWSNDFSSSTLTDATLGGVAAIADGKLTLNPNATSTGGNLVVNASGQNATMFHTGFDMTLTSGGSTMADGLSYSFADDAVGLTNNTEPTAEKGSGSKLRLLFMTYNGSGNNAKGVYLVYGATAADFNQTVGNNGLLAYTSNTSWIPTFTTPVTTSVSLSIDEDGKATVTLNGTPIFTNVELPAGFMAADKASWKHAFSSRAGGVSGGFALDNIVLEQNGIVPGYTTYQEAVSSTSTFYVAELSTAGCEGSRAPVTVTVNTPPAIAVTASPATVCAGVSSDLEVTSTNSGYTYTWEPGEMTGATQTVTPVANTTYTVTATDNSGGTYDGCVTVADVSVTVNSLPLAPDVTASVNVCEGTASQELTVGASEITDVISLGDNLPSPGPATNYNFTIPALPPGAVVTSTSLQLTNVSSQGSSWLNEIRIAVSGITTLATTQIYNGGSGGGTITTYSTPLPNIPVTGGVLTFTVSESYDDSGDDAAFGNVSLVVTYTLPYTYSWWDATTGGTQVGLGATFEAIGSSILPDANTPGTYTFYVQAEDGTCGSTRVPIDVIVNAAPTITVTPSDPASCSGAPVALEASGADTYTWSPSDDLDVTTGANVTSTPTETRTYTVSGTDGAGCVGTTDVTVTYEEFTVTAVSSDADFCLGTSTTLSASNNMLPQLGPQTLPTGYCTPTVTSSDGSDMINNFSFASITNNNSGQSPSQYGNFTATYSADVIAGTSYPISLQAGSNSGQTFKVWIDYNRNGVFEASEVVFSTASSSTTVQTGNIVISPTATLGVTRMRVGSKYSTSLANGSACANTGYGEFEDYQLNIIAVPAVTYTWSPATDLSAATGEEVIATPTAAGDYTYTVTATNDNGCTATNDVTITVNPNSVVTASNGSPVCEGSNVILTGTTTPSGGDYVWYYPDGSLLASGILSVNLIDADLNTNGTYSFSVTNELGCTSTATTTVVVNPLPSTITIAATDEEICTDEVTTLTASGGTISGIVAFYDGFEGATWTAASTGSISQNWHINADGSSNSWPEAIHSNDNSHYYIVDANASSSSGTMNATLTSPSFSTAGFESANLDFYHYLKYGSGTFVDSGVVQMSTDNVTWTTITNYQSDQGAPASFAHATLAVPAQFLNQTSVYIRFKFAGGWGYYWHIDNVSVTGSQTATVAWAPATGLYTDASATTAYAGEDITTVYAKPASSTTYTATATSLSGCSREASVEIAVTPPPVVTVTPDETDICEGSSAVLTASVSPIASTILEEDFNGATNDWTTIDNTIGVGLESPAWTLRPDGYSNASYYVTETFHSNDNSQFYMTNSDAPATSSVSVNTILQSPAFSTLGYAEASINYYQAYKLFADYMATTAKVEASTDGSTWTTLQDNTVSVGDDWELAGTSDGFVSASVPLTAAFLNQPVVYIRFNYSSGWEYYWAIDNVSITGTTPVDVTYTWSPAGGTVSGSNNENYTVNPSETTVYTATATTVGGCSSSTTATVNVNAVPAPVLATATDPLSCGGSNGSLTLESLTPGATYSVAYDKDGVAQSPQTLTADGSGQIVLDGLSSGSYTNVFVTNTTTTCSGPMPISAILNEPALPAPAVASSVDPSTCSGSDGSITLSGLSAGTGYSVAYDKDGVAQTPQSITADGSGNVVMTALSSGAYTNIIVTSSVTTCSSTSALSATLSSPVFTITATPANNTDCSAPNGSITITSSLIVSGQSYTWYYDAEVGSQTANASDAIVLEGLNAATYADIWVYDATTGCTSNTIASVTVGGTPVSDDITAVDASSSQAQSEGTVNYNNADCEKIATIEATNGDLGSVTAEVEVVGSVGTYNDEFYFGRVYHLTASNNVGGIVTLYFSDAEIAAYNTAVGSNTPNYPVVMSDGSNITITAFHGTPGSGSGPLNYDPATAELIIPSSIVHNANGYYEVTFSVGAFSGFFGTTNSSTPLPVKLVDVSAVNLGATNRVDWSTAAEADGDRFMIERSADAKAFNSLGTADAKGISGSRYSFVDANPFNGVNYYRIKVLNNDGSHFYSKVVQATVNMGKLDILAYPNPVKDELTVKANGIVNGTGNLILFDVSGRELSRTVIESNGIATFQMDHLAQGMYILKFQDDSTTQTIRVNKK